MKTTRLFLLLGSIALCVGGCDDGGTRDGGDGDVDGDTDVDGDAGSDGDADSDSDGDVDSDGDGDGDGPDGTDHVAAWVLACWNEDGGFGSFPGDRSALRPTLAALETLEALDVEVPSPELVAGWVLSQRGSDGGFHGRPWGTRWTDTSTLVDTYHAVRALEVLSVDLPRSEELIGFVESRQRSDGAFLVDNPAFLGDAASCESTYDAVAVLGMLGEPVPSRDGVVRFLTAMQANEARGTGGFRLEHVPIWSGDLYAPPPRPDPYVDPGPEDTSAVPGSVGYTRSTWYGAAALALLESEPGDLDAAIAFLVSQQHDLGGFVTGMGDYGAYHDRSEGRLEDTHHALAALELLASIRARHGGASWEDLLASGAIDVDRCVSWIASCQNPEGGFARRPEPVSRPSDMEATRDAVRSLVLLGAGIPMPAAPTDPSREELPDGTTFPIASLYFLPDQEGQALYVYRIVGPIRDAAGGEEETAIELIGWVNRHLVFGANTRREAALIVEDGFGNCGGQSLATVGLLEAVGIETRLLEVVGHNSVEALIGGRFVLLDPMFQAVFRRSDSELYSGLAVHEHYRLGEVGAITTFGDFRYESYTIYWPQGDAPSNELELWIGADDGIGSEAADAAYPGGSY